MNILISGGAGYIGSSLAHFLIKKKFNVTIIDNLSTGYKNLIPRKASFIQADISNIKKINKEISFKKIDILIHLAAFIQVEESTKKPNKYFKNNVLKSKVFLNNCLKKGIKKIIFSSTAAVYKSNKNFLNENSKLKPLNPYAKNKLVIEKYLKKLNKKNKFKYIIFRYFNVAGALPDLSSGQISKKSTHLIKVLSEYIVGKRNKFYIYGDNYSTKDGSCIRDFIHIFDLCRIHLKIISYLKHGKSDIFNCGYGKGFSVFEVFNAAKTIFKKNIRYKISGKRRGDVEKSIANVNKINKTIKFKPKYNDIKYILKSSIDWEKKLLKKNY